jgi:hypothetical protein
MVAYSARLRRLCTVCQPGPAVRQDEALAMVDTLDPELLAILVCPESHAPLVQVGEWLYSTDGATRRRYPVREGIPIMLIDESEVVEPPEFEKIMNQVQVEENTSDG